MDTELRVPPLLLEDQWAEVWETLVQPPAIIESFEECKDIKACVVPAVVHPVMSHVILHRGGLLFVERGCSGANFEKRHRPFPQHAIQSMTSDRRQANKLDAE